MLNRALGGSCFDLVWLMLKDFSQLLRVSTPLRVKFTTETGVVSGIASTFGGPPDAYGDIIAPGAFAATIARHKRDGTMPVMLWSHNASEPIGRWDTLRENANGLFVEGRLNLATDRGTEAYNHLKFGDITGLSVGYRIAPDGFVSNDDGTTTLTEIELYEVSAVAFPANRNARITAVKSIESANDIEQKLRSTGVPRRLAIEIAEVGWKAIKGKGETPHDEDLQKALGSLAATLERSVEQFRKA